MKLAERTGLLGEQRVDMMVLMTVGGSAGSTVEWMVVLTDGSRDGRVAGATAA